MNDFEKSRGIAARQFSLASLTLCAWLACGSMGCALQNQGHVAAIQSVLSSQQEAWNSGDIDAFMNGYWQSDDLTFSSGGATARGWRATLDRYKKRYNSPAKMGRLSFDEIETKRIGANAAMILGRWQLDRDMNSIGGRFTLIFRRIDGRWVIVHDHTSVRSESDES